MHNFKKHKKIYCIWLIYTASRRHAGFMNVHFVLGVGVKMEHFQAALDPRKQELLEARFLGAKVRITIIN